MILILENSGGVRQARGLELLPHDLSRNAQCVGDPRQVEVADRDCSRAPMRNRLAAYADRFGELMKR